LILSSFEFELLRDRFRVPENLLLELGFSYPDPDLALRRPFTERRHLVSIGNFRHLPNRDSAFWMARTLWPRIREALAERGDRETELHLYGAYPPKEMMALDDPKGRFRVLGPADDSIATLRNYRTLFAPLRFGAGIKGKIADAWSAGIPVVTTPIGAEGMRISGAELSYGEARFGGEVADTEDELVASVVRVHGDESEQRLLVEAGDRSLETLYSVEGNRRKLFARLEAFEASDGLARMREANMVGRILRADFHGRTKYFSKWIEAKTAMPMAPRTE
jgi:glycosyltransferase involved in cell wall biosynthesis